MKTLYFSIYILLSSMILSIEYNRSDAKKDKDIVENNGGWWQ